MSTEHQWRSYELRLRPTHLQRIGLSRTLLVLCDLYNAALQERRGAWRMNQKSIGYFDQQRQLTELHKEQPELLHGIGIDILRDPLRRVDFAFKSFFRRARTKQVPGFPRFRASSRYDSFSFGGCNPVSIRGNRLRIPNLGRVRFRTTQTLPVDVKTATIKRRGKKWFARIICDVGPAPEKVTVSTVIGIDVGLTTLATLSNGTEIENPRWTRQHEERIAKANQNLARKNRGSKNRQRARIALRRVHERASNARDNYLHHVSKWLVQNYDLIAYEKLQIKNMTRGNLAKSIMDAAWAKLIWQISYKAESAGRYAIAVNPRGTSQRCSGCGETVKKTLADREHSCPKCGLILGRDHNAAINILRLGESLAGIVPSEHAEVLA